MHRFSKLAIMAAAVAFSGCTTAGHRNIVPNEPGERNARLGVGFAMSRPQSLGATVIYTGAIGIPGQAEAGFDGPLVYVSKLVQRTDYSAVSTSLDVELGRGFFAGSRAAINPEIISESDTETLVRIVASPRIGPSVWIQLGRKDPWRIGLGTTIFLPMQYDLNENLLYSSPLKGALALDVGKHIESAGITISARIVHTESLTPTGEDQPTNRSNSLLVGISFD